MKGSARLRAGEPDLRRAEEQGIYLVEVSSISLKDLIERSAIVPRRGSGNLLRQALQFTIASADRIPSLTSIEDAIVGPTDSPEIVLCHRWQRSGPRGTHHSSDIETQRLHLVQPGFDD